MQITVTNVIRDTRFGMFNSSDTVHGWNVSVRLEDQSTLILSKLDSESGWTADAYFGSNGYPHWSNGFGARYLATKQLVDTDAVAAIEAAVAAMIW